MFFLTSGGGFLISNNTQRKTALQKITPSPNDTWKTLADCLYPAAIVKTRVIMQGLMTDDLKLSSLTEAPRAISPPRQSTPLRIQGYSRGEFMRETYKMASISSDTLKWDPPTVSKLERPSLKLKGLLMMTRGNGACSLWWPRLIMSINDSLFVSSHFIPLNNPHLLLLFLSFSDQ